MLGWVTLRSKASRCGLCRLWVASCAVCHEEPPAPRTRKTKMQGIWDLPKIRGTLIWGPYNKRSFCLGYYIRVPYFRKPPYILKETPHITDLFGTEAECNFISPLSTFSSCCLWLSISGTASQIDRKCTGLPNPCSSTSCRIACTC